MNIHPQHTTQSQDPPMSSKQVVGLIQVDIGDTSIGGALFTCANAGLSQVIVVDANRGEADYRGERLVKEGKLQVFYEASMDEAQRRLAEPACASAAYVFEVPPTFRCDAPGLVTGALRALPDWAQQTAYAPCYYTPTASVGWPSLALLTHLVWSLFSVLSRNYVYRGSYAVLRAVSRQRGMATIATAWRTQSKWRKHEGAIVLPLPGVSPIYEFLYWMNRESFGWRRWLMLIIYVRLLSFPYWGIAYNQWTLTELFPVPLLLAWLLNGLVALMYAQHYFPTMALPLVHAFGLPLIMVPWLVLCLYAKTVWRGYQGEAPRMQWPDMPTMPTLSVPSASKETTFQAQDSERERK